MPERPPRRSTGLRLGRRWPLVQQLGYFSDPLRGKAPPLSAWQPQRGDTLLLIEVEPVVERVRIARLEQTRDGDLISGLPGVDAQERGGTLTHISERMMV